MRGRFKHVVVSLSAGSLIAAFNVLPSVLPAAESALEVDPATAELVDDIDAILDDPRMDGSQAAVQVIDADTGEIIYDRDSANRLMPASNQKLFTAAAALDILGPDYTWSTTALSAARQVGSTLRGDLYLRGGGDPTLLAEDYAALAKQVADAGIKVVSGDLVADDTFFDDVHLGPDWSWDDEAFYYAAPVSSLTVSPDTDYDAGTVIVRVAPGTAAGEPPVVTLTPSNDYVEVVNKAETTAAGTGRSISITKEHGLNQLTISGRIATDASALSVWRAVWEPTALAADVFRNALADAGVQVTGDVRFGAAPAGARTVAEHTSMTLAELLIPFMKLSNNGHAEVLVKTIGHEVSGRPTWSSGVAAVQAKVAEYGVDTGTLVQRDGSGLSRRNFVPSAEVATLLHGVQDEPWFDAFYQSLPVAGVSERFVGGTLRFRMSGTPAAGNVHAKTGSLTGATALSGYVTTADGQDLIFAIIMNNYLSAKPSDLEDRIAIRLASHGGEDAEVSTFSRVAPQRLDVDDTLAPDGDVECSWVKAC